MRLVTRADFDGLVCGALITAVEKIDSYLFVEPKFVQDGMVKMQKGDVIANLPYDPNCTLWFDHHITNAPSWLVHIGVSSSDFRVSGGESLNTELETRNLTIVPGKGAFRLAPSAARVVFEYYTTVLSSEGRVSRDPSILETRNSQLRILTSERMRYLLEDTDKIDAGQLTPEDVLDPNGYVLVSMTIDGKRVEDEPYWARLIELLRETSLEETLQDREVKERCQNVLDSQEKLKELLLERATLVDNVLLVDLRGIRDIPDGNRFLMYTLFPGANISLKVIDDVQRPNTTSISVGYNIFNPTSKINVGALMEKYGGGGHRVVGSCRVANAEAQKVMSEILEAIRE